MRIQRQDMYYGPLLQQIAEYPVFTTINSISNKPGVYLINESQHLLIKYSTEAGPVWSFSFSSSDIELCQNYWDFHVALNCGNDAICLLSEHDLFKVVDKSAERTQTVRVTFHKGSSMRVAGPKGNLGHNVAHNSFPGAMLGRVAPKQVPYAMPEFSQLTVYHELPKVVFSSTDRMEDLSDRLGCIIGDQPLTVYLGLSTLSHKWPEWTDAKLKVIERQIRYDLGFDGFTVKIQRHTPTTNPKLNPKHQPASDEFLWKLTITA